jgi:putative ABC transport system permease protein
MLRATIKGMVAHKLRLLLTATSIALGVAFLAGTLVLTDSMQRAFDDVFADAVSGTDVAVRAESQLEGDGAGGTRPPLPAELLDRVGSVDGIAAAEGRVEGYALITDRDGKPIQPSGAPTLGLSLPAEEALRGDLSFRAGRAPAGPSEVAIDASSAAKGQLAVGDRAQLLLQQGPQAFSVVGIVGYGEKDDLGGATTAYFDLATAQRVLGKDQVFDSIVVAAAEGVTQAELADRIGATLPAETQAVTGAALADEQSAAVKGDLKFLTTALTGFAGIALFVGAFIIWNTFSMQVAQRTRELALFRAIGATRRQVRRTILTEAVLLGLVSSLLGIGLGLGMARGLAALMGGFGLALPTAGVRLEVVTVAISLAVGTLVTVASAVAPARRATKVLPVEALRDSVPGATRFSRVRLAVGLVMALGGTAMLLSALFGPAPAMLIVVGVVTVVLGITTLAPLFMRPLAAGIGAPLRARGLPGDLARQNAMRNPRRTASTAMALVIGLTLVAAVAVFAASLKASFGDLLATSTNADLYVLTPNSQSEGFSPAAIDTVRDVDGVGTVSPTTFGMGEIGGAVTGFRSVDPGTVERAFDLEMRSGAVTGLTDSGVLVHQDVAERDGLEIGDAVAAAFGGTGRTELRVEGIFAEKGFVGADYVLSRAGHLRVEPDRLESTAVVLVEDGTDVAVVQDRIADVLAAHPDATVMNQKEFEGAVGGVINQLLGLVTVLLLLAVLIALLGIVNTLALSVFERTRELGMLRAVGMTRGQVRAMVRWESVVISIIGALLGAGLGVGLGVALTKAMADQGIEQVAIPSVQLALYVVAAAARRKPSAGPAGAAARLEEGEDRADPPVAFPLLDEAELLEDAGDVLLDRPLAHVERARDRGVAAARGHLLQHLAFALGQPRQRRGRLARLASQQAFHDPRVQCRAPARHLVQRTHELVGVGDPFLEQVAEAGHPVLEQVEHVLLLDVLRQHDDARPRMPRADLPGRVDALGREARGHPDVGQDRIGRRLGDGGQQRGGVVRDADQLDVRAEVEQRRGFLPHQEVVLGEDHAQGHGRGP